MINSVGHVLNTDGDNEWKSAEQMSLLGFCTDGRISEIECRDVKRQRPVQDVDDVGVVCSLKEGLSCKSSRQPKGKRCHDYEIRYYCQCHPVDSIETTVRPIIIWTAESQLAEVCDPKRLVGLLSDAPDSAFSATSSLNSRLGPSSARLDNASQTSWVAGVKDTSQYIQVDIGSPRRIFGVELSGSPTERHYVTSLFVLYSLDKKRFSYVLDDTGSFLWHPSAIHPQSDCVHLVNLLNPFSGRVAQ